MQQELQYSIYQNIPWDEREIEMPALNIAADVHAIVHSNQPAEIPNNIPNNIHNIIQVNPPNQTNVIIQTQQPEQMAETYLKIGNIINFNHNFEGKFPCCCGSINEWSHITVEPIGKLDTGYDGCYCCCVPCLCCIKWLIRCAILMNCDYHVFHRADYKAQNPLTSLEFWQNGMGRVKIYGVPVLDFVQTHPNCWDALCGHCLSSYPKLEFYSAQGDPVRRIVIQPDRSYLPETIFSIPAPFAPFGMFITSRSFTVTGLTSGTCKITNTRTFMQACAKIFLVQGVCCLPHVDYPNFQIEFSNDVPQLDRLAVLMGLVHYTIFKKWYLMTVVRERLTGVA